MPWYVYAGFVAVIAFFIYLDLNVLHKEDKQDSIKTALFWTSIWVCMSLLFSIVVYCLYEGLIIPKEGSLAELTGKEATLQYLTGYLVEYTLSLDNIFVIALIISAFRVPSEYQHRLLFWGILGAALLRGVMIGIGAKLIHEFEWTIAFFGGLLILSALKMLFSGEGEVDTENNFLIRIIRKIYPVTNEFHGKNFFTVIDGKRYATPMLLALVLIEGSDVVFAVDSIPAIFGVTKDPFLVFTSNIFAILGLRSLYFALAGMMGKFEYLKYALIILLFYIGGKMLALYFLDYEVDKMFSLGVIVSILGLGVLASLLVPSKRHKPHNEQDGPVE